MRSKTSHNFISLVVFQVLSEDRPFMTHGMQNARLTCPSVPPGFVQTHYHFMVNRWGNNGKQ